MSSLEVLVRRVVRLELKSERDGGVDGGKQIAAWHSLMRALGIEPRCRRCGCTQDRACPGGCAWAALELCSTCELPYPSSAQIRGLKPRVIIADDVAPRRPKPRLDPWTRSVAP